MKKLGLAVLIAALLALPMSALALEKMSGSDMGGVVGQAGVTVAFGSTSTTVVDFSQINWGDPDGVGTICASLPGWVIIDGVVTISQEIAAGQTLTLDVGTTGAAACAIGAVTIPSGTTFIAVGLPTIATAITWPATMTIGLGTAAGTINGTLGILNLAGLSVSTGSMGTIYIYAHP
jgi:hypothetical protein